MNYLFQHGAKQAEAALFMLSVLLESCRRQQLIIICTLGSDMMAWRAGLVSATRAGGTGATGQGRGSQSAASPKMGPAPVGGGAVCCRRPLARRPRPAGLFKQMAGTGRAR